MEVETDGPKKINVDELKTKIQNCVYTCYLFDSSKPQDRVRVTYGNNKKKKKDGYGIHINLNWVVANLHKYGIQLNKKRFAAAIVRSKSPKIAILVFSQGKIVCTGAKHISQARTHIFWIVSELKKMGYKRLMSSELKIENVVASTKIGHRIDINSLATEFPDLNGFNEKFPGSIFRHPDISPITILIFTSGKLVITGAKDNSPASVDIKRALNLCLKIVENFIIDTDTPEKQTQKASHGYMKSNHEIRRMRMQQEETKAQKVQTKAQDEAQIRTQVKIKEEIEEAASMAVEEIRPEVPISIIFQLAKLSLTKEDQRKVLSGQMLLS
jgi:transcription initiation factor TFIID TATA-box-binding protein